MKQYYTANISKANIDLLYGIGYDEKISPTFTDAVNELLKQTNGKKRRSKGNAESD